MLDRELAEEVLRAARRRGGSFAELFVEERSSTSVRLDDGKVEELTTGLDRGAGVRVAQGTSYGYAYSNRLDRAALLEAAAAASAALREGSSGAVVDLSTLEGTGTNRVERPAGDVAAAQKVAWLRELDDTARAHSPEVVQVVGVYGDSLQRRVIATSDGRWIEEDRPRIRLVAQVVAKRGDNIQTGFHGPAACAGVEFLDAHGPSATAEVAARRAVTMLDSIPAPAGEMTVVLAPGMGGVLFHEAVGHPLESDAVDKEASIYRGARRAAMRERADQRRGRRHRRQRVGVLRLRRRGDAEPAHGPVHRRGAPGVPLRPAARGEGGRGLQRERAARVLRPSAGPAHDQHLHPERQLVPGRGALLHAERRLRHLAGRGPGESGHRATSSSG